MYIKCDFQALYTIEMLKAPVAIWLPWKQTDTETQSESRMFVRD